MITIIVATNRCNVIGLDGRIPWHCKADLQRFRRVTEGKTVIMGRNTYDSLPNGPLPNRKNVVITSVPKDRFPDGVGVYRSLTEAIRDHNQNVYIIGGEQIYREAVKFADRVDKTIIQEYTGDGDRYFPGLTDDWRVVASELIEERVRSNILIRQFDTLAYGKSVVENVPFLIDMTEEQIKSVKNMIAMLEKHFHPMSEMSSLELEPYDVVSQYTISKTDRNIIHYFKDFYKKLRDRRVEHLQYLSF